MADINTTSITKIMNQFKCNNTGIKNAEEELEGLFASENITMDDAEAEEVNKKIKNLESRIKALAKRAEQIKKDIAEKEEIINETNGKLLVLINNINAGTREYKDYVDKAVMAATNAATQKTGVGHKYNNEDAFEEAFNQELIAQLNNLPGVKMEDIKAWYGEYDKLKTSPTFKNALSDLSGYSVELNKLQTQLRNTNGTINFLSATRNSLAGTTITKTGAYKNVDTDINVPIYSGKKEITATDILCKNYENGTKFTNTNKEEAIKKWTDKSPKGKLTLKEINGNKGDRFNIDSNASLGDLRDALRDGMVEDLRNSGLSTDEILTLIRDNWFYGEKDGSFKKEGDTWKIPKGHGIKDENGKWVKDTGAESQAIFNLLIEKTNEQTDPTLTADKCNEENVSKLMTAMGFDPKKGGDFGKDNILDKMAKEGFTFKEAMYVIDKTFNSADGLESCGIVYDINKQNGKPTYGIASDTADSNGFYKAFAEKVEKLWDVKAENGTITTKSEITPERTDPMTFQQDNTTYTFLAKGALDDKSFNGTKDLLGANSEDGMSEWAAFDTDGNGKIDGDELKNVFLMKNVQKESSHDKASITDTNTVDFTVNFMSAADLGITEIAYKNTEKNPDAVDTTNSGKKNINKSEILSNFKITTDGTKLDKDITAQQTKVTDDYLKVFYKQLANTENITVKQTFANFSKDQIDDFFNNWYSMQVEVDGKDIDLGELNDYIQGLIDNLSKLIDKYKDVDFTDTSRYDLNIDYAEFTKWYGGNIKDSLYVQKATQIAYEVGFEHRHDDGSLETRSKATQAVQEAIDNAVYDTESGEFIIDYDKKYVTEDGKPKGIRGLGKIDIKDDTTREEVHKEGNEWLKKNEHKTEVQNWKNNLHLEIIEEKNTGK